MKKGFLAKIPGLSRFTKSAEEAAQRRGLLSGVNAVLEQANIPLRGGEALAAGLGLSVIAGILAGLFTSSLVAAGIGFVVVLLLVAAAIQFAGTREKRVSSNDSFPTPSRFCLPPCEPVIRSSRRSKRWRRKLRNQREGSSVVRLRNRGWAGPWWTPCKPLRIGCGRRTSSGQSWRSKIQREVGGNLAEVLQTVADTMRQRNRLKGEIRALTAEGRLSGIVLALLPIILFAFLFTTNRSYLEPLFSETAGLIAIGVGIALMGAGVYWLKKIVDIEV